MIKRDDFLSDGGDFISEGYPNENKKGKDESKNMYNSGYEGSNKQKEFNSKEVTKDINFHRLNKSVMFRKKLDNYLTIFVYVVVILMVILFIRYYSIIV